MEILKAVALMVIAFTISALTIKFINSGGNGDE